MTAKANRLASDRQQQGTTAQVGPLLPSWSLPVLTFLILPALPALFAARWGIAELILLYFFVLLTWLLLLGQGNGLLSNCWPTAIFLYIQKLMLAFIPVLLLFYLGCSLPVSNFVPSPLALIRQSPFLLLSLPLLLLFLWLSIGWSGRYSYNPLVLQLSRCCLYLSQLLTAAELSSDRQLPWPLLALLTLLPIISRIILWLRLRPLTLLSCEKVGTALLLTCEQLPIRFSPGQFVYLYFPWNYPAPLQGEIPLSLASAPGEPTRLLVRLQDDVDLPLSRLRFRSPQGYLYHNFTSYPQLLLLAAGLGVSPFASILSLLAQQQSDLALELHWFVREEDAQLLHRQLEEWRQSLQNLRIYHYVALTRGQIRAAIDQLLAIPDRESGLFVCGPVGFNRLVKQLACQHDWPRKALHYQFI